MAMQLLTLCLIVLSIMKCKNVSSHLCDLIPNIITVQVAEVRGNSYTLRNRQFCLKLINFWLP
uniref:Uncharacterized protein n=1 Tax=Octopus bimaculoides TaxID=37653 RepID=A0A0L8HYM1_OCTBM